ncbi:hypothetical protein H9X85_10830 [Anaerotignum lactatifermentans]|uniref:RNA polymerase sigma-70 region 4 domain-containing protein n=1 Tax=Anaerotignum lactatifermentans TaxID=160404 RepID=A0ABS2GC28_9FIRM|nr:hypothetical protein [Anaerotignum lactatifermentans]MBM6830003.1 hypothetical protein [Anaerotignum lactatifermentans]MBM6878595.1 hypothetical protein [Anaerotignum lactatifermentans]MBM6951692.1 hypothetical protein [Anaerotignum lactatifermentans]
MSNNEKKKYLRRYLDAKRRANLLQEQIESLRENKTSPSGTLDGMPHGSGTSDLSGYAARLDELLRELETEREMQMITYHEIWNQVKKIPNATEQEVLTRRYLIGQSWEKIAVEMHYSYRQIIRIHGAALQHFSW